MRAAMRLGLCAALLAAPVRFDAAAKGAAMDSLVSEAGEAEAPQAPPVPAERELEAPAPPQGTVACAMSFTYTETTTQLAIIRIWKELDGIAKIECAGKTPVRLKLKASGLSLGLGLPNSSPFHSTNEGVAGAIEVRLPAAFSPKDLEGEYARFGAEIGGVGAGVSPWINQNASFQMVLHLPTSFNASAAINLEKLELYLLPSNVDW